MDLFGIGNAFKSMIDVYRMSSRATGRTTLLVESVKNGDRIIFNNAQEARRVERLIKDRGLLVQCITISCERVDTLFHHGSLPDDGRTIFDHGWVEAYYEYKIKEASNDIDHFEKQLSGHGEVHRKNKRQAIEISKWRM